MAIILKNAPKTEEGRRLNFSKEDEEKYRVVFRYDEKTKELVNVEPWSAELEYDNYSVIVPFTSTFVIKDYFGPKQLVQNVVGSKYDPKPDGYTSWMDLIRTVYRKQGETEDSEKCCLDGNIYDFDTGVSSPIPEHYTTGIVGGHMVLKGKNKGDNVLSKGADFVLMHICRAHNLKKFENNYFKPVGKTAVLVMTNFLQRIDIEHLLLSLVESTEGDGDIEFDVKKYCEENGVEVKDMYFE